MGDSIGRWLCASVLCASCTFNASSNLPIDAPDVIDTPDAPVPARNWVVISQSIGANAKVTVIPATDGKFEAACAEQPVPGMLPLREIVAHPDHPYVYAVDSGFYGAPIACGALTWSRMSGVTTPRPIQRIVYDAGKGVGFFTGDGPGAVGVYRFTTAADGTPTLNGTTDATSESGPLTLDGSVGQLFVAGPSIASSYALVGTTLDLPTSRTNMSSCGAPADVLISGDTLLSFCSDSPDIWRFSRTPFAGVTMGGMIGPTDRVIALPNDRAIAARQTPDLAVVNLGGGTPTWKVGPTLGSRINAITASNDGTLVAVARLLDATTSEVALWQVDGDTLTSSSTTTVPGVVTAVAIASRPM